jgi:replicative DNA helicase
VAQLLNNLTVPSNIGAERSLLSAVLADPNTLYNFELNPAFFYKPEYREIAKVIKDLYVDGQPITMLSITERLRTSNKLDEVGGVEFLATFRSSDFSTEHVEFYNGLLRSAYTLRAIINLGQICIDTGYHPNIKVEVAKERILREVDTVFADEGIASTNSAEDLVEQELTDLNERMKDPTKVGVQSGYEGYDTLTGGFRTTDLIILGGRPGMGKTALAVKMLMNVAKRGIPIYLIEKEMGKSQLIQRMLALESGVNLLKIRNGQLNQSEYDLIVAAMKRIKPLPFYIENEVAIDIYDILTRTRKMVRTKGVQIMALDHVQLLLTDAQNETAELSLISRSLKNLAMDSNISVLMLSQLNRSVEQRNDKRPILSDLRQSGSLEQDADIVNFLYREEVYNPTPSNAGMAELIIAKHRNGPIGTLPMIFRGETTDYLGM